MRLKVNKTHKMLIGGAFVRSESNRTLETVDSSGEFVSNYSRASRKDVRDAVLSARNAAQGWAKKTAYNRGQILYRLAEMLEAKSSSLEDESVDRLLYYAGWSDKYQQLLGTVNPVAVPYFNFSVPEPMGVVGIAASGGLLGIVSLLAPVIVGGNTCVVLAPDDCPVVACEFAEVVATSDVPPGVVNILTGTQSETLPHLAKHMDVNALAVCGSSLSRSELVGLATENMKRLRIFDQTGGPDDQGLSWIEDFQEIKTVWHPVGS